MLMFGRVQRMSLQDTAEGSRCTSAAFNSHAFTCRPDRRPCDRLYKSKDRPARTGGRRDVLGFLQHIALTATYIDQHFCVGTDWEGGINGIIGLRDFSVIVVGGTVLRRGKLFLQRLFSLLLTFTFCTNAAVRTAVLFVVNKRHVEFLFVGNVLAKAL